MAIATRVEETAGVRRYQVLQTARDALTVRLENNPGTDRNEVWGRVREGLTDFLRTHDATGVVLHLAAEPPQVNPRSGKLRHVVEKLPPGLDDQAGRRTPRRPIRRSPGLAGFHPEALSSITRDRPGSGPMPLATPPRIDSEWARRCAI